MAVCIRQKVFDEGATEIWEIDQEHDQEKER